MQLTLYSCWHALNEVAAASSQRGAASASIPQGLVKASSHGRPQGSTFVVLANCHI